MVHHRTGFTVLCLSLLWSAWAQAAVPTASLQSITEVRTQEPGGSELRLWIRLEGEMIKEALEYDDIHLTTARDDAGADLLMPSLDTAPTRLNKPVAVTVPTALFPVVLKTPARSARTLTEVNGTVLLRTFRRQVVLIDLVRAKSGQAVENPLFKAHEVEVFVTDPVLASPGLIDAKEAARMRERAVSIRFSGQPKNVLQVELLDAAGVLIPTRQSSFGGGRTLMFTCTADQPLPDETQARISIPTSPEDVIVPFTLKNITLP
jgi:hypothetical protein